MVTPSFLYLHSVPTGNQVRGSSPRRGVLSGLVWGFFSASLTLSFFVSQGERKKRMRGGLALESKRLDGRGRAKKGSEIVKGSAGKEILQLVAKATGKQLISVCDV